MTLRRFSSVATETTLTTGITAASTGLTLTNPSGYPAVGPFSIRAADEAILIGTNTGGVFTDIERGFDGTSAVAHSTTDVINHVAVGDDFRNRWQEVALDRPHGTYDDEFGSASLDTAWVEVTPTGTVVWTQGSGVLSVTAESQTSEDICGLVKPFPVFPPRIIETAVRVFGNLGDYTMAGLVFSDGTTVSSNAVAVWLELSSTAGSVRIRQRSGTFTAMTDDDSSVTVAHYGIWLYMRLRWKAINTFEIEVSTDGVSWVGLDMADMFLTFTPTHAGLMFSSWGDAEVDSKVGSFEYFRTDA